MGGNAPPMRFCPQCGASQPIAAAASTAAHTESPLPSTRAVARPSSHTVTATGPGMRVTLHGVGGWSSSAARSGAISFCALKLIEISREIRELLANVTLSDPEPVTRIVEFHLKPLYRLLERAGVEEPAVLVAG